MVQNGYVRGNLIIFEVPVEMCFVIRGWMEFHFCWSCPATLMCRLSGKEDGISSRCGVGMGSGKRGTDMKFRAKKNVLLEPWEYD